MTGSGLDAYPKGVPNYGLMAVGAHGIKPQSEDNPLALSLLFTGGRRPAPDMIARLSAAASDTVSDTGRDQAHGFSISHQPPISDGWIELLAAGMTFDLIGLAPMRGEAVPLFNNRFGFKSDFTAEPSEAIVLRPGLHIAGGQHIMPVVRVMAGLAAVLATIPGVTGLCWHPARSLIEPRFFVRSIGAWLDGGAFPALGLTALNPEIDGGLLSEGLAFFTGQELRIEPFPGAKPSDTAKLAIRLIHTMVESGPLEVPWETTDDHGHSYRLEPSANAKFVRVWRLS